jgi:hypothetical protein
MSTPTIGATLAPYGERIKVSSGGREGIFSITSSAIRRHPDAATSSALGK